MAREGVAQLEDGRERQPEVIADEDVAAVGDVLGIVQIPHVAKGVVGGIEQAVEGEAAEDALLLALNPIHADIEPLRRGGIEAGEVKIVDRAIGRSIAGAVGIDVALGEFGEEVEPDGVEIGVLLPEKGWRVPSGRSGCVGS